MKVSTTFQFSFQLCWESYCYFYLFILILQSVMFPLLTKTKLIPKHLHPCISMHSRLLNLSPHAYFSSKKPHQNKSSNKILERQERRKIKEKMERQQIEEMNRKVNLTSGGYNPMTSYLSIYKYFMLGSFFISALFIVLAAGGLMMGRSEVWVMVERDGEKKLKQKKKFMVISEEVENQKSQGIQKIFTNIYEVCEPTKSQTAKIEELKTSGIESNITVISSQQPILLILPGNSALISNFLLRRLDIPQLSQLFLLLEKAFQQRYHIRDLQVLEILTFRDISKISNQIKLREIYSRVLSEAEVLTCLSLMKVDRESIKQIILSIKEQYESTRQSKMQKENILRRLPLFE